MNEPFSCPNSSLSISSDGMAAQLTSTKGRSARRLSSCSRWATSSLPVPLSPVISTRASEGATFSISCFICSIPTEVPTISVGAQEALATTRAESPARAAELFLPEGVSIVARFWLLSSTAERIERSNLFRSIGLGM